MPGLVHCQVIDVGEASEPFRVSLLRYKKPCHQLGLWAHVIFFAKRGHL